MSEKIKIKNFVSSVQVFFRVLKSKLVLLVRSTTNGGLSEDFCCDPWDYKRRVKNEYSACSNSDLQTFLKCLGSSCFATVAQI